MRAILTAALLLAACSGGEEAGDNATPPAPAPTGPAPKTPLTQGVIAEPGNTAEWMEPSSNADDPTVAPFDQEELGRPLVNDTTG